jgi:hemoglobin
MASIYEQIGGAPAVAAAVDDLYGRILGDDRLSGYFADTDMPRQKRHLRAFMAAALGGTQLYAGAICRARTAGWRSRATPSTASSITSWPP